MKARNLEQLFPPPELERITEAVEKAERLTCGEIVPYVVPWSDSYVESVWRAAATTMGLILLVLGLVPLVTDLWLPFGISAAAVIALGGGLLAGSLTALVPALRRALAGRETIDQRVAQRAAQAFIAEEVFHTRERTGILIFLSLLERRVVVLGDAGINARVEQSEWHAVTETVADGIRNGHPANGLVEAIARCGALLADRGFALAPGDLNELPNSLRMGGTPEEPGGER